MVRRPDERAPGADPSDGETQPEVEALSSDAPAEEEDRFGFAEPGPPSPGASARPVSDRPSGSVDEPGAETWFGPPASERWPLPEGFGGDDWVEEPSSSRRRGYAGDGPFAVDVDEPTSHSDGTASQDALLEAFAQAERHRSAQPSVASARPRPPGPLADPPGHPATSSEPPTRPQVARGWPGPFEADGIEPPRRDFGGGRRPYGLQNRHPTGAWPGPSGTPARAPRSRPSAPPVRRYPRLRALLREPELVPEGSAPASPSRPPPVPGTFIPHARIPPRPAAADLDRLLASMAEGLFVREDEGGATEIRVTLKDAFFAGTELRIALERGEMQAILVPPDREVHAQLAAETHRLRDRLEDRGLRVTRLEVQEPEA